MGFGCEWVRDQLRHDLGRNLVGQAARDLEEHLAHCDGCRVARSRQAQWVDAFRALRPALPPADLWDRIQAEIARRESRPRILRWLPYAVPAAAAAMLLIAGLYSTSRPFRPGPLVRLELVRENEIFSLEELRVRDAVLSDNPFVQDGQLERVYFDLLKGDVK